MTPYQSLLLVMLFVWPAIIFGLLALMARLEKLVERSPAETPKEAGLEPTAGSDEREVRIRFGDRVVGEPEDSIAAS